MIYLIGGPPKCGKTTLAKQLAKKKSLSWIQGDTLQSMAQANLSSVELKKSFPWKTFRKRTGYDNDKAYQKYNAAEIVRMYVKQSRFTDRAIEAFVQYEIEDGHDFIIEGYEVHPALVARLQKQYGPRSVRAIFLVKEDADGLVSGFKKGDRQHDWILKGTKRPETFEAIANMIALYSKRIRKEAERRGLRVMRTDRDFKKRITQSIRYLS